MGGHVQTGIAACFAIDDYERDVIKKHEKTHPDKEDDRTRHMLAIGAQTGPVFLTYPASPHIDELVARTTAGPPLYDFVASDEVRHVVWTMEPTAHAAVAAAFTDIPLLYIADGHHRAASAARTRRALAGRGAGEHDRVLAVAFPDNQMQILPYHRVVRDLNGLDEAAFLTTLGKALPVTAAAEPAARQGHVGVYVGGRWYDVDLGRAPADVAPDEALDVSRLQTLVLAPVLNIHDVRTDKRIDFVGGIRGTGELRRLVDSGAFAVAFAMFHVSIQDLMTIADAGGIMPPKSTWFEPKLRDGLLSHLI
jgi:uncharacterized protein (DUF1015 family)